MTEAFRIEGGHKISGTIAPTGNKNAALPLLAACLLTDQEVTLHNVPRIVDVEVMMDLLRSIGATVTRDGTTVRVHAAELDPQKLDGDLCGRIRGSVLLAGPLLARTGQATMPRLGGDVIGRRRVDTHALALEALGAKVEETADGLVFSGNNLQPADVFLDEPSVTGTENVLIAAASLPGTSIIQNAASEPHVQDLCKLLQNMGAQFEGLGSNRIHITGSKNLGGAEFTIGPDHIEVGSLITLAAVTGGELTILNARPEEQRAAQLAFQKIGIEFHASEDGKNIVVPGTQPLSVRTDLGGAIPKIEDAPWPGFPADLMSIAIVGATQAQGTVLIHQKMFESRLFFVDRLIAMGAAAILCDPHRVVVTGRTQLQGRTLVSPDIRAGMALVIAALCAEGVSTIQNIQQIDRGYQDIDNRLNALGAQIERVTA